MNINMLFRMNRCVWLGGALFFSKACQTWWVLLWCRWAVRYEAWGDKERPWLIWTGVVHFSAWHVHHLFMRNSLVMVVVIWINKKTQNKIVVCLHFGKIKPNEFVKLIGQLYSVSSSPIHILVINKLIQTNLLLFSTPSLSFHPKYRYKFGAVNRDRLQ